MRKVLEELRLDEDEDNDEEMPLTTLEGSTPKKQKKRKSDAMDVSRRALINLKD
jgi:hypothetical protein